jgi:hypothetical protein
MAVDTFMAYVGVYSDVAHAEATTNWSRTSTHRLD